MTHAASVSISEEGREPEDRLVKGRNAYTLLYIRYYLYALKSLNSPPCPMFPPRFSNLYLGLL